MSHTMNHTTSVEPFNRLVKLAARAFYDDVTTKGDNQQKTKGDNRGIAVVVLDALTRRQWVREEDLAKDLKLHSKQLRRTLRFFEEEKLVTRDHRRETAKGAKIYTAAIAAVVDSQHGTKEGEEKIKMHTHSYCCLDYAQIFDVVRYRLHRMKKKLKDELDNKNTVQEYICPNCGRRYNALDALRLISMEDEYFHCENCNGELVAESDKLAAQEGGDGDENARRRRREKLKDMLQNLEVQLKPLMEQINRVKDLQVPEFGTLQAWEARASASRQNGGANDSSKSSLGLGYGGTSMPFGDTKVEVDFSGPGAEGEDTKSGSASTSLKVLPPWMIKQEMKLTNEQRGEIKQEAKMESSSAPVDVKDEKKPTVGGNNAENFAKEYIIAYYAAMKMKETKEAATSQGDLLNTQIQNGVSGTSPNRQVGMKCKRDEDDGDDDDGWEEAPTAGNASESYKVNDLNVQADALGDDEDGSDWEEG